MKPRPGQRARSGFSLLEVVVAATVAAAMIGAVGLITLRASSAYREGFADSGIDVQAQRAIERVADEFMDADRSSLGLTPTPPQPATSADFARTLGFAAGGLVPGPRRRIRLEFSAGELDNDLDDDGDGLVDEGRIVLYPDVVGNPGLSSLLVEDVAEYLEGELRNGLDDNGNGLVDERGFTLAWDAQLSTLTLRATVVRAASGRPAVARTAQTSVWVRNE